MTPQPSNRLIPTQDEFDAWCQHPVSQFVAEAYRLGAVLQREEWAKKFDARLIPADIALTRLELKTREDAYQAFLETTLADYIAIVSPEQTSGLPHAGSLRRRPQGRS